MWQFLNTEMSKFMASLLWFHVSGIQPLDTIKVQGLGFRVQGSKVQGSQQSTGYELRVAGYNAKVSDRAPRNPELELLTSDT